jgi:glucosamine 6-phosphate synthetase-like amidotransferase/phosphosugar isomerase protein
MIYQGDALNYIYETPEILQHILENEQSVLAEAKALVRKAEITEVYITGSGSSYNAAVAAAFTAKKLLGIRATAVYPVTLLEECEFISEKAVVLGISQQGTSMTVIHTLDVIRSRGIPVVSITGEYNTEIIKHGDANIYIECGYEDAGATTKGYTSTVLTLILFLIMLAEDCGKISLQEGNDYRKRIETVIQNMNTVLEDSKTWCNQTVEKIKDCDDLIIISSSNLKSLLLESVLKFSETCRFPVRGYEVDEFMHGMYNAVTERTNLLYLYPASGDELERMEKLFEYYEEKKIIQYAINMQNMSESLLFRFLNDPDFSSLEYNLPQQMLFVLTSRARGINLNIPKDPEFHKYMGSKLEQNNK